MERVRNSWWYSHQRLGSHAQVVYGDIYRLPSDIGRFDVATFGSILMHLSRPFAALALRPSKALREKQHMLLLSSGTMSRCNRLARRRRIGLASSSERPC